MSSTVLSLVPASNLPEEGLECSHTILLYDQGFTKRKWQVEIGFEIVVNLDRPFNSCCAMMY